jgi:hypothetical protein
LAPAPTDTDVEPSDGRSIRVVLADDHASMGRSLRLRELEDQPRTPAAEAIRSAREVVRCAPDVRQARPGI